MTDPGPSRYHEAILRQLDAIMRSQAERLEQAAQAVFATMRADGVLHVFGSGHSHALAEEAFHRAGGLVPVNAIQEIFLTPLTPPDLSGRLEMLMAVGTVGGTLQVHAGARLAQRILTWGAQSSSALGMIIGCVGLASNLAALRALATEGIQRGHMTLHRRSAALARARGGSGMPNRPDRDKRTSP